MLTAAWLRSLLTSGSIPALRIPLPTIPLLSLRALGEIPMLPQAFLFL
jgi:hypothetical protein